MSKVIKMGAVALAVIAILTLSISSAVFASTIDTTPGLGPAGDVEVEGPEYGPGPAPYSGDGIPDGPGW